MPRPRLWKPFLLAASYVFYGAANPRYVFLLAGCTVWNQMMALAIHRQPRQGNVRSWLLALAIAGDLGLLGWFKYYGFFVNSVEQLTSDLGFAVPLPLLQVALPAGISFFTFQAISYVADVRRDKARPAQFMDLALYLSFFPHLIAGPIVRSTELIPQFASPRDPRRIEAARAFSLICGGLIKKVIIADLLATNLVDPVFGAPILHSRLDVIAAIYGYTVQIYCDFSAYTDMAIGLALLLGFQLPQNFDRPYLAFSFQEFWRRWNMTLSRWLRDYLYIGLGGNRKGRVRTYVNLFLTMLLGGLWHGAAWHFVIWGGLHGIALAIERRWMEARGKPEGVWRYIRWFITFNLVCLLWVFFRADSLGNVAELFKQIVVNTGSTTVTWKLAVGIIAGLGAQFVPRSPLLRGRELFARVGPVVQGVGMAAVLVVCSAVIGTQGVAPFIYFRF